MKKRVLLLGIISILIIVTSFGCGASGNESSQSAPSPAEYAEDAGGEDSYNKDFADTEESRDGYTTSAHTAEKIIYSSEISLETEDFEATINLIEQRTREVSGYIERSSIRGKGYEENDPKYASYTLRIPVNEFDFIKNNAKNWGNVTSMNTDSEDVTSQYYDIQTRLETLKVQEDRLLELLRKASEMEDMIALERELQDIRYQIENFTGTVNQLDALVDYATINIHVYEVETLSVVPKTFTEETIEAAKDSVKSFSEVLKSIFISLIYFLPYLVIIVIAIVFIRKNKILSMPKWKFHRIRKKDRE